MICQDDYELKVLVFRDIYIMHFHIFYLEKKNYDEGMLKFQIFYRIFSNVKVKIKYVIMEYNI